jgi:xanthine dehydrogenase YagR molybdenum-binding subunit
MLYQSPALLVTHRVTKLNVGLPTYMRAPGESSGSFALESAMDELAHAAQLDPIQLRLRNYADADQDARLPFSIKSLRGCYRAGAEAFDWNRRTAAPGSMRDGRMLVGLGMATATYPTNRRFPVVESGGVDDRESCRVSRAGARRRAGHRSDPRARRRSARQRDRRQRHR